MNDFVVKNTFSQTIENSACVQCLKNCGFLVCCYRRKIWLPICVWLCKDCKVLVLKIVGSDKFLSFLLLGWWAMFCSGSKELLHHSIPTHQAHILVNRLQHLHLPTVLCMPNHKLTHNKLTPNKHMPSSRYIY